MGGIKVSNKGLTVTRSVWVTRQVEVDGVMEDTSVEVTIPVVHTRRKMDVQDRVEIAKVVLECYVNMDMPLHKALKHCGISTLTTFADWRKKFPIIRDLWSVAKSEKISKRSEHLESVAMKSLERNLRGHKVELKKTKVSKITNRDGDEEWVEQEMVIQEQYIKPDPALILQTLKKNSDEWSDGDDDLGNETIPLIDWVD